MADSRAPPNILLAVDRGHQILTVLRGTGYSLATVATGTDALAQARADHPDTIILDERLPDMSGIDACAMLHNDPRIGHNVPILILAGASPTPEQRVAAMRAGAWDFLPHAADPGELRLKLETYIQAKRNLDVALAEGVVDPATGLHSLAGLARRARELEGLLSRKHEALACVVIVLDGEAARTLPDAARLVVRSARVADVVATLRPGEFAVMAPGTDQAGALEIARRITRLIREALAEGGRPPARTAALAGYAAVGNLGYTPLDPMELLARATAAARGGVAEPDNPWIRRFDPSQASRSPRRTPHAAPFEP